MFRVTEALLMAWMPSTKPRGNLNQLRFLTLSSIKNRDSERKYGGKTQPQTRTFYEPEKISLGRFLVG